ncbi:MAG: hypothetical protein OFPII_28260 [Osedax symbiont Rs1]|nr:MAG: hypothetical protein OFPII_28260 [Osedax symbiont Rs1]
MPLKYLLKSVSNSRVANTAAIIGGNRQEIENVCAPQTASINN